MKHKTMRRVCWRCKGSGESGSSTQNGVIFRADCLRCGGKGFVELPPGDGIIAIDTPSGLAAKLIMEFQNPPKGSRNEGRD